MFLVAVAMIAGADNPNNISITNVSWTPEHPVEGESITIKATVTVDGGHTIDNVNVQPCWDKPTGQCGFPVQMTDKGNNIWEGTFSGSWVNGAEVHANITATDDAGGSHLYSAEIHIGPTGPDKPEDFTDETSCETAGFHWWNEACHENAAQPSDLTDQTSCEGEGFYWWDSACHDKQKSPDLFKDKDSCKAAGYYWWDSKCNEKKKPADNGGGLPGFELLLLLIGVAVALVLVGNRK
jgi:hypothetical protein